MLKSEYSLALALCCALVADAGEAQTRYFGSWYAEYAKAERAGQISSCNAGIKYNDGFFIIRIHSEYLDFLFSRDAFTLPYDANLGKVIFRVNDKYYLLEASTNSKRPTDTLPTEQMMFLNADPGDYGGILSMIRSGSRLSIIFPNNDEYYIGLNGSSAALDYAQQCWSNNVTGPWSDNPFESPALSRNPFDTL